MAVLPKPRLERQRMSLAEYDALPEGIRAEYVDGEVVVSPPASIPHNQIGRRVMRVLEDAFRHLVVAYEVGLVISPTIRRIPDIALLERAEDVQFTDEVPVVVVEILSPSTRSEDTLRKSGEYREAGAGQYWIVDPERQGLTVLQNSGSSWDIVLELDRTTPVGEVRVDEHGSVTLDLDALLGL